MHRHGADGVERYRRDLALGVRTSVCVTCGRDFTYRYVGGVDRSYCDEHVTSAVKSGREYHPRRKMGALSVPRDCVLCGHSYYAKHPQQKYCPECARTKSDLHRAVRYQVSASVVREMKDRFDGLCWICHTRQGACVDHNHATGAVRGWLCRACNGALHYMERPAWMVAASAYLTEVGAREDLVAAFAVGGRSSHVRAAAPAAGA
jgi:hypothetical protein